MNATARHPGKLQVTTPSDREIAMIRTFDAPREMVFDAWTKPELIRRWLGSFGGWKFEVCEVDLRVGGKYRYVWRHPDGQKLAMGGVYQEVTRPARLVATELFDDPWYGGGGAVDTTTFVESGGKTTVTSTILYSSKEVRDSVLASPMEGGVAKSYDNLDDVLASMPAKDSR
jgi:uncharacterized protein YndB with AHSA1/START domain